MDSDIETIGLEHFEIDGNTLIANVELYWENHLEFSRICQELLASEHKQIVLDFSNVNFIFSAYMGTLGKLMADAARAGKALTIRINRNLSWLFEIVGIDKTGNIEIVA